MRAILTLASGKEMPNDVTKLDLTIIIVVLCQQLDWIEEERLSEIVEVAALEEHSVAGHDPLNIKTDQHESGPHILRNVDATSELTPDTVDKDFAEITTKKETELMLKTENLNLSNPDNENAENGQFAAEEFPAELPYLDNGIKEASNKSKLSDGKVFSCYHCMKQFYQKGDLKRHERIHGEKRFHCPQCDYKSIFFSHLKAHERIHTGDKPYNCSFCDYKCTFKQSLKRHERRNHLNKKETKPKVKPEQLNSIPWGNQNIDPNGYAREGAVITEVEDPFKEVTPYLNKDYSEELGLNKSERSMDKLFSCRFCMKQFSQKGVWKRHEKIHNVEKQFHCSKCDYKCIQLSVMKQHERIHTGEKPYSCSDCDYKCNTSSLLKRHQRRIHIGDRKYACLICEKKFKEPTRLKAHESIHTGDDKPHCCYHCGKKFRDNYSLKRHEENKHSGK